MLDLKPIFEIDIKKLLKKKTHTHNNNKIHVIEKIKYVVIIQLQT
jgi:hypothetical protein